MTKKNEYTMNAIVRGVRETGTRVQILDETDCNSYSANILGKGMNPVLLPPTMG